MYTKRSIAHINNCLPSQQSKCQHGNSQVLTLKPNYAMVPSAQQIINNNFLAHNLQISHQSTTILWPGLTDMSTLSVPLSELVTVEPKYVQVYPCSVKKPEIGRQLNKQCLVQFRWARPANRGILQSVCIRLGCELIWVSSDRCRFIVQIHHFSRYGFDEAEQKEDESSMEGEQQQTKQHPTILPSEYSRIKQEGLPKYLISKYHEQLDRDDQQEYERQRKLNMVSMFEGSDLEKQTMKLIAGSYKNIMSSTGVFGNNMMPAEAQISQVRKSNIRKNKQIKHSMGPNQISGHLITYGMNCQVKSVMVDNNMYKMLVDDGISNMNNMGDLQIMNLVVHVQKHPQKIPQLLCKQGLRMRSKRILALYLICFRFYDCKFDFVSNQVPISIYNSNKTINNISIQQLSPSNHHNKHNNADTYRMVYLKSWLQWVINTNHNTHNYHTNSPYDHQQEIVLPTSPYLKELSLRNYEPLALKCVQFNKYQQAEFLSRIEDEYYRDGLILNNLAPHLQAIASNNFSSLDGHSWIVRLAMLLWYYKFEGSQFIDKVEQILKAQNGHNAHSFQLQRYILMMFFDVNGEYVPSGDVPVGCQPMQALGWQWFISNTVTHYQKSNHGSAHHYSKYRFNLLYQIVQHLLCSSTASTALAVSNSLKNILVYDNHVSLPHKQQILFAALNKHRYMAQYFRDWAPLDCVRIVAQVQATHHYTSHNYLQALSTVTAHLCKDTQGQNKHSDMIQQIMWIIQRSYILMCANKHTLKGVVKLLNSIPDHQVNHKLGVYRVYLAYRAGTTSTLTTDQLSTLIDYAYEGLHNGIGRRIADGILSQIMVNTHIRNRINNSQQYFDQVASMYHNDPKKYKQLTNITNK